MFVQEMQAVAQTHSRNTHSHGNAVLILNAIAVDYIRTHTQPRAILISFMVDGSEF
jgi:hypothetical protein